MAEIKIYGNWKMNKDIKETIQFSRELAQQNPEFENIVAGIAPPFVLIHPLKDTLKELNWKIGAQNSFYEKKGAFTGEISPVMLKSIDVDFVILGHSERRNIMGETSEVVAKKIRTAIDAGLEVVLCVGETLEEREKGREKEVIKKMVIESLNGIAREEIIDKLTIAYEPVWAIGTGVNAAPEQIRQMHCFIRDILDENFGDECGRKITIQYGGSVKPENAGELLEVEDIDGFLVGGASLQVNSFLEIIKITENKRFKKTR